MPKAKEDPTTTISGSENGKSKEVLLQGVDKSLEMYQVAPRRPSLSMVGGLWLFPTHLIKVLVQPRDGINHLHIKEELVPGFLSEGRQIEPGKIVLTGDKKFPYGLIGGNHRFETCKIVKWHFLAVLDPTDAKDEKALLRTAIISNSGTLSWTPFEVARNARVLLDLGDSLERVAQAFHMSLVTLNKRMKLEGLIRELHSAVLTRELSLDVAVEIAQFPPEEQLAKVELVKGRRTISAVTSLKSLRKEAGHGDFRRTGPRDVRRGIVSRFKTIEDSLADLLLNDDSKIEEVFSNAEDAQAEEVLQRISTIQSMLQEVSETFELAIGEGELAGKEAQAALSPRSLAGLKDLLDSTVGLGLMSKKIFNSIFAGTDPGIGHDQVIDKSTQAEEALKLLKKRVAGDKSKNRM